MKTTDDMADKIGKLIKSFISALTNNEAGDTIERKMTDWRITEAKARSIRSLALLRRRMARFDQMSSSQRISSLKDEEKPTDEI